MSPINLYFEWKTNKNKTQCFSLRNPPCVRLRSDMLFSLSFFYVWEVKYVNWIKTDSGMLNMSSMWLIMSNCLTWNRHTQCKIWHKCLLTSHVLLRQCSLHSFLCVLLKFLLEQVHMCSLGTNLVLSPDCSQASWHHLAAIFKKIQKYLLPSSQAWEQLLLD